jgi:hypothetical protein
MFNLLPSTDPLDTLVRSLKRARGGPARILRPALPGQVDLGASAPLDAALLGALAFASGTLSLANHSTETLDLGNLSTALGPAVQGSVVFYNFKRGADDGMGASSRHCAGVLLVLAHYWNGSGSAILTQLGSAEDSAQPAGISASASVVSDRLQLTFSSDNSGDDALGQYRCFPWPALSPTAP